MCDTPTNVIPAQAGIHASFHGRTNQLYPRRPVIPDLRANASNAPGSSPNSIEGAASRNSAHHTPHPERRRNTSASGTTGVRAAYQSEA